MVQNFIAQDYGGHFNNKFYDMIDSSILKAKARYTLDCESFLPLLPCDKMY